MDLESVLKPMTHVLIGGRTQKRRHSEGKGM